jgi:hypothetical protein
MAAKLPFYLLIGKKKRQKDEYRLQNLAIRKKKHIFAGLI